MDGTGVTEPGALWDWLSALRQKKKRKKNKDAKVMRHTKKEK
jgi:hypothetical protein